jgi:hypothetical protein
MSESFEEMLSGGHPNSLGRTIEVVNLVLADRSKLQELYDCWHSKDELVRLRVSNAMKRVMREHPDWLISYIDRFITDISKINQPSTQWTIAQLYIGLNDKMTEQQRAAAIKIVQHNLERNPDWIVQNTSMQALADWAESDVKLRSWLLPRLQKRLTDSHKSISGRAKKLIAKIEAIDG